jgi:hypothetical protein
MQSHVSNSRKIANYSFTSQICQICHVRGYNKRKSVISSDVLRTYTLQCVTEPEFVNLLRSPGIYSQPGEPVRLPYFTFWPARARICNRLGAQESIPRNRFRQPSLGEPVRQRALFVPTRQAGNPFLCFLKGLQIRAQAT